MALFLEWYLFDNYVTEKSKTVLEVLIDENRKTWPSKKLENIQRIVETIQGLFLVKTIKDQEVKVLNLLSKGAPVSWTTLRNKFDLTSPRAMVDQLRTEGHMVYINQTSNGTSYRLGTPTKSILAAGASKIFKKSMREIVAAGIKSLYGTQKYAYSNR